MCRCSDWENRIVHKGSINHTSSFVEHSLCKGDTYRFEDLLGVADGAAPSPDGVTPPRPASASELSDLSAAAPGFTSSAEADDEATPREGDRARLMTRPRGGSHE